MTAFYQCDVCGCDFAFSPDCILDSYPIISEKLPMALNSKIRDALVSPNHTMAQICPSCAKKHELN